MLSVKLKERKAEGGGSESAILPANGVLAFVGEGENYYSLRLHLVDDVVWELRAETLTDSGFNPHPCRRVSSDFQ